MSKYEKDFIEIKKLGKGGFGEVFMVQNKLDLRNYAIKKIQLSSVKSNKEENNIMREVKSLAALQHSNVVRYHTSWFDWMKIRDQVKMYKNSQSSEYGSSSDFGDSHSSFSREFNDTSGVEMNFTASRNSSSVTTESSLSRFLCIQMQLCDSSLDKWLKARNEKITANFLSPNDVNSLLNIYKQLLHALAYIHSKNILHRDLKPGNILLNGEKPDVLLGDFGLSRMISIETSCGDISSKMPVEDTSSEMPVEDTSSEMPVEDTSSKMTVEDTSSEMPVEDTSSKMTVEYTSSEMPVEDTSSEMPVEDTSSKMPVEDISSKMPVEDTSSKMTVEDTSSKMPVEDTSSEMPVEDTSSEMPVEDTSSKSSFENLDKYTPGCGTLLYAAPEQLNTSDYDFKADMYSAGVTLYEMTSIFGESQHERIKSLDNLRKTNFELSKSYVNHYKKIAPVIVSLVSQDPKTRPSADELLKNPLFLQKNDLQVQTSNKINQLEKKNAAYRKKLFELGVNPDDIN